MNDTAHGAEGGVATLPAGGGDDAAHRPAIKIDPAVAAQIFQQVDGVLHQTRHPAVVARRGQQNAVGLAHGFDKRRLLRRAGGDFRVKRRQGRQFSAAEQLGLRAERAGVGQRGGEGALGAGARAGGAADADQQRRARKQAYS
jgi:hypothetical protein